MNNKGKIVLTQVIILLIGMIGFVYFIGNEVVSVSAETCSDGTIVYHVSECDENPPDGLKSNDNSIAPAITASPTLAKPGSTYLSNFVGTGYAKGTYTLKGKYYTLGKDADLPEGGTMLDSWRLAGSGTDALLSGLNWATYAYIGGQMLGSMMGLGEGGKKALSTSMAAGFG